ncbi:hypothetical protein [Ancylothrix sp. D3o]|nr:hypothetical protein [Ancylothrix sp. D3o]
MPTSGLEAEADDIGPLGRCIVLAISPLSLLSNAGLDTSVVGMR